MGLLARLAATDGPRDFVIGFLEERLGVFLLFPARRPEDVPECEEFIASQLWLPEAKKAGYIDHWHVQWPSPRRYPMTAKNVFLYRDDGVQILELLHTRTAAQINAFARQLVADEII